MSGHHPWATLRDRLGSRAGENGQQTSIRRATEDAVQLGKLREAMTTAHGTAATPAAAAEVQRCDDPYLMTLATYVQALGGTLELRAVFPDQTIAIIIERTAMTPETPSPARPETTSVTDTESAA